MLLELIGARRRVLIPFNSLFEMPAVTASVPVAAVAEAFNSLFEMLSELSQHGGDTCGVAFNSLFEMQSASNLITLC